jgi:hypothetical protein
MGNFATVKFFLVAATFLGLASSVQAAPSHTSARAEREQTRALNEQQSDQARQQNAGLAINTASTPTDAAATAANNAPPVAAPTARVQQANNLPRITPAAP